jgi:hypothetical protein
VWEESSGERQTDRQPISSEEDLSTSLHLAAPKLPSAPRSGLIALLPARLFFLLERKHVRDGCFGVAGGEVVVLVQVDLSDEEHVLATDEVGASGDVGEEALLVGGADEVAFGGGVEDQVC